MVEAGTFPTADLGIARSTVQAARETGGQDRPPEREGRAGSGSMRRIGPEGLRNLAEDQRRPFSPYLNNRAGTGVTQHDERQTALAYPTPDSPP